MGQTQSHARSPIPPDLPHHDIHDEILGAKRGLAEPSKEATLRHSKRSRRRRRRRSTPVSRQHVNKCRDHDGGCSGCLRSEDSGLFSGGSCSYCPTKGMCSSSSFATCPVNWIGTCGVRCGSRTCRTSSQCSRTNDGRCDEGDGRRKCPDGTDRNDCARSMFVSCETMDGSTCRRCLQQSALGGGYCGWNPTTEKCKTSRLNFARGFGRCACDSSDGSDVLSNNDKCDGIPGRITWLHIGLDSTN
jgi:hypothetical protein